MYRLPPVEAGLIYPLAGKTDHYVKDSGHFMEIVNSVCLDSDDVMVSYDVSSLFTNVPIQEAIDVIRDMLQKDETLDERMVLSPDRIAELLETCLSSTCYGLSSLHMVNLIDGPTLFRWSRSSSSLPSSQCTKYHQRIPFPKCRSVWH